MADNRKIDLTVTLNSKQAENALGALNKRLKEAKEERKKAFAEGKDVSELNKEIKQLTATTKTLETNTQRVNNTLKSLSTASVKDLKATMKALNRELQSGAVERNSKQWRDLQARLKAVKGELSRINAESRESASLFSRASDAFNKYAGLAAGAVASLTGLTMTVRSAVGKYAEMEDSLADVRKYTGMTDEEVRKLQETFKQMDTRTSREELNELAGAAGRLGLSTHDAVVEFVDGADKISVALGDDLGEGAVDAIGKLAMMFGEDKTKGLRGAMLATGSALNELAASSSAQAGNIVEFTKQLGGVAKMANMSQTQVMGLASALDQNMQEMSTSSTVFSQLITKMFQDPARFANIAGKSVSEFSQLIKTDMNGALLEFLEAMRSKGGFDAMAPMFQEMKLDGTRAVGVISTVADHLNQVKEAQKVASEAYKEGTSVINEFNTVNNTAAAQLDKAKKRFQDLTIELGEKLMPVAKYGVSTSSMAVKGLMSLVDFTSKYGGVLVKVIAVIAAYTVASKARLIIDKAQMAMLNAQIALEAALTAARKFGTAAMLTYKGAVAVLTGNYTKLNWVMTEFKRLNLSIPWGAIVASIVAVGMAVYELIKALTKESEVQKMVNSVRQQAIDKAAEEKTKIQQLVEVARDETLSLKERQAAIEELNKIIPYYNAQLDATTGKYIESKVALDRYNDSLERKYMLEAAQEKLSEIAKKRFQLRLKYENDIKGIRNRPTIPVTNYGGVALDMNRNVDALGRQADEERVTAEFEKQDALLKEQEQAIKNIRDENRSMAGALYLPESEMNRRFPSSDGGTGGGGGGGYTPTKKTKNKKTGHKPDPEAELQKKIRKELEKEKLLIAAKQDLLDADYAAGEVRYREYLEKQKQIALDGLDAQMKVLEKNGKKESEEYKALAAEKQRIAEEAQNKIRDYDLKSLENEHKKEVRAIEAQMYDQTSLIYQNEDAKNEALFQAEMAYLQKRQALYKEGSEEWMEIALQMEDTELNEKFRKQEAFQKKLQDLRKKYDEDKGEKQRTKDLDILDQLHEAGLVQEEEYQHLKQGIIDKANEEEKKKAREKFKEILSYAEMAYDGINNVVSAAAAFAQASSDEEVAKITANYDRQIEAAGSNSRKRQALEKERDEKIRRLKNAANKRAMAIEIAQATASTAMAAVKAYADAPAPHMIWGPIASAMAIAAGMLQIATIKKQHQAQAAGYAEGGYTGRGGRNQVAGVVHKGEWVAPGWMVDSPATSGIIEMLDAARRSNSVAAFSGGQAGRPGQAAAVPVVNVSTDNREMRVAAEVMTSAAEQLNATLKRGIHARVSIDGEDGIDQAYRQYKRMIGN